MPFLLTPLSGPEGVIPAAACVHGYKTARLVLPLVESATRTIGLRYHLLLKARGWT